MTSWPTDRGSYVLVIRLQEPVELVAGRLGRFRLEPGLYAYTGSARGPGGLRARLSRHLRPEKRPHWHVDYLTEMLPIAAVHCRVADESLECLWVPRLLALPGASAPVIGFGSSDCRAGCPAHLIRLPCDFEPKQLPQILEPDVVLSSPA